MNWHKETIQLATSGKGLYSFTDRVQRFIQSCGIIEGMCFLYVQHTSASLVISESFEASARQDLETFMEKLVPESQPWHRHTTEGSDDSSSHMRSMLTNVSLEIPVEEGRLALGTWQGIYLFEHRTSPHRRQVLLRCLDVSGE